MALARGFETQLVLKKNRLLHHAYIVQIMGESNRLKDGAVDLGSAGARLFAVNYHQRVVSYWPIDALLKHFIYPAVGALSHQPKAGEQSGELSDGHS
jgi:hypothetical protein